MITNKKRNIVPNVSRADQILSTIDVPFDDGFVYDKTVREKQNDECEVWDTTMNLKQTNMSISDETYVETDYKNKKFIFIDKDKNMICEFSVNDLIKYMCGAICNEFMKDIDDCANATSAIEKYIGTNTSGVMQLYTYAVSPFMASVDTVAKLYVFLIEYKDAYLQQHIMLLDAQHKTKILTAFYTVLYEYSIYIIQLISLVLQKEQTPNATVNSILFQYACFAFTQITKILKILTDQKINEICTLETELTNINDQTQQTFDKINVLQNAIEKHNAKIDVMFEHMFAQQPQSANSNLSEVISLQGGNKIKCNATPNSIDNSFPPENGKQTINYLSDTTNVLIIE